MAKQIVSSEKLDAIADAIRAKTHKSDTMTLDEMPEEIESISGGGITPTCGIVPTSYSSKGFVLSATSYGDVQMSAMQSMPPFLVNPEQYTPETTDPFIAEENSDFYAYSCTYQYITDLTFATNPTIIGTNAFYNCYWLTLTELPDTLESIGSGAFGCCYNVLLQEIPASVTFMGYGAFYESGLVYKTLPAYDSFATYSAGDCISAYSDTYTCISNNPSSPDDDGWIRGYYPELLGIYDYNSTYNTGDIVAYESSGQHDVATILNHTESQEVVWSPGYAPETIGVYRTDRAYSVGDVILIDYSPRGPRTCISPTVPGEYEYSYWTEGCYPEMTGYYDNTKTYSIGDIAWDSNSGEVITCVVDVDSPEEYDSKHWTAGYAPNILGIYDETRTYNVGDVVAVDMDGSEYSLMVRTCIFPVTSPEPFDAAKWVDQYCPDVIGIYDSNVAYTVGDVVVEGDRSYTVYTCISNNPSSPDDDGWIGGYYPDISIYDPTAEYVIGSVVYSDGTDPAFDSYDGVFTLGQLEGLVTVSSPIEGIYAPDLLGIYDPSHTYNPCDIVMTDAESSLYICISPIPITGEWDSDLWVDLGDVFSDSNYKIYPLIFRGTPEGINGAFAWAVYNVALVPWSEGEGPYIDSEDIPIIIYDYNPNSEVT